MFLLVRQSQGNSASLSPRHIQILETSWQTSKSDTFSEQMIEKTYLKNLKKNGKLDKLKMYFKRNQNNNKTRRNKSCDQESRNLSNARLLNSWKMRKVNKKFVKNVVTNQKVTSGKGLFKSIVFCVQVNWKDERKCQLFE